MLCSDAGVTVGQRRRYWSNMTLTLEEIVYNEFG